MAEGPRFLVRGLPLVEGATFALPEDVVRHVQVLRMQPGQTCVLFDGQGTSGTVRIEEMSRRAVDVLLLSVSSHLPPSDEVPLVLAVSMPANDRMDFLVEKATELGAAGVMPLMSERSVLRLQGERAQKRQRHWQAIADAACEQSGRMRQCQIALPQSLNEFLGRLAPASPGVVDPSLIRRDHLAFLSTGQAPSWTQWSQHVPPAKPGQGLILLSGPEGGWTPDEEQAMAQAGAQAFSLGSRILRADTAPLCALSWWSLQAFH